MTENDRRKQEQAEREEAGWKKAAEQVAVLKEMRRKYPYPLPGRQHSMREDIDERMARVRKRLARIGYGF